jgi:Protein of unknown function (DUF3108)
MLLLRSYRGFVLGLLAICVFCFGLKLAAQQSSKPGADKPGAGKPGGGLTQPPKPVTTTPASASTASDGPPFIVGERLSFNVSWANFPTAASLDLEVTERGQFYGQDSFQIRTRIETIGQVRSLFSEIDNQYISYVNPNTGIPLSVVSSIRQGKKQSEETVVLDQSKKQAIFPDESTIRIPAGTYDLPSLIYGLRLRSLTVGMKQKLTALYGRELIEIEAIVKGRERITTQTGTYNTLHVKFYPQKRLSKYRAYVWFSDDGQKLPVLITAKLPFGEVRAELTNATVSARPSTTLGKIPGLPDESGALRPLPDGANGKPGGGGGGGGGREVPFTVGERLNYDISWGGFAGVGKAAFEVRQQGILGPHHVFEFYGEATSTGAARVLVNVNDQIRSYALVDKLIPVRTDLRLREGKRFKQVSAVYDWKRNSALLSSGSEVRLRAGTLDMISLFYAVRAADLKIGAVYNYLFLDANYRLQNVTIKVAKQEAISGPLGNRDALQLDVLAPAPSQALLAQVWISNDSRRLPLYLAVTTRFGELRFQLTSSANTK